MTLTQLKVFITVVETGSFSKAGEILGLSQPAISHAIAGLESALGSTLLIRNRNGISLSEIGAQIVPHIREMLRLESTILEEIESHQSLRKGTVRIGSFPSISASWLPSLIPSFKQAFPEIDLHVVEGTYEEIEEWITRGIVQAGFVTTPCHSIEITPLCHDELVAVLPPDHSKAMDKVIPLQYLDKQPFILPNAGCQSLILDTFKQYEIYPDIRFELRETSTILQMVKAGEGATILPLLALQGTGDHHSNWFHTDPPMARQIGIAVRSRKFSSPATRAFVQHVENWINQTDSKKQTTP